MEPNALSMAGSSDIGRADCVNLPRQFLIRLALVHGGHGGTVDNHIGAVRPAQGIESGGIGNVRFREISGDQLKVTKFGTQGTSEHPLAAGQKNFHGASLIFFRG